jgi:hypothetical protein
LLTQRELEFDSNQFESTVAVNFGGALSMVHKRQPGKWFTKTTAARLLAFLPFLH